MEQMVSGKGAGPSLLHVHTQAHEPAPLACAPPADSPASSGAGGQKGGGGGGCAVWNGSAMPTHVRASRYEYDFARVPSPWARRLPTAVLVGESGHGGAEPAHAAQWWVRRNRREYVRPFARGDGEVRRFLDAHGLPDRPMRSRPEPQPPLLPRLGAAVALREAGLPGLLRACALGGARLLVALLVRLDDGLLLAMRTLRAHVWVR